MHHVNLKSEIRGEKARIGRRMFVGKPKFYLDHIDESTVLAIVIKPLNE